MRFWLALLLLLGSSLALAQERKYAVLSLIGDQILIVERETGSGSGRDRNSRTLVPIEGMTIEKDALFAVEDVLKKSQPGVPVVLLGARSPELFAAQARLLDEEAAIQAFLPTLRPVLEKAAATHLVLVTKLRHEARLRVADGTIGGGKLEGVGFYLDPAARMRNLDSGEMSQGYVAPFAYFRLSLVDLVAGKVVADRTVLASTTAASQKAESAWTALSPEQKAGILRALIRREVLRELPGMLR